MIKHTILGFAVLILAGCVTYYPYPELVYSASDNTTTYYDQGYDTSDDAEVVYGSTYYYPWWSVDYFYLGNHYYRPSHSFSFSYGNPWYSPYYGYYGYPHYRSPWYPVYYGDPYAYYGPGAWWGVGFGYGNGWYDPYWYGQYRGHDHFRYGHDDYRYRRGYGRGYAGNENRHPQNGYSRDGQYADRYDRGERNGNWNRDHRSVDQVRRGQQFQVPTNRRVSVAPAGPGNDRSMVVVNRSDAKPRESRAQPIVSQERYGEAVVRGPQPNTETRAAQQGPVRVVQPVVRMPAPQRQGPAVYASPNGGDSQPRGQSGGRAAEYQARSNEGGGRESNRDGNGNRESYGDAGQEPRGERGGRGNRDRD